MKISVHLPKLLLPLIALSTEAYAETKPRLHHQGLHGYLGFNTPGAQSKETHNMGMSLYSAIWPLADEPLALFQIGLPSTWIIPDNRDNRDQPLAPEGTRARKWPERGPTWASVFQTLEGGPGYWRGNRFRYGPPKFSMNATPQCYDYEVASPGWSFFYDTEALADERMGVAQLSNRLLIPPDGLPFEGNPNGQFIGYGYMALPLTAPTAGDPPTGEHSWTCFLNTANFKGPIAYYIPETWSKIARLFNEPFLHGRGLDSRPGLMRGGAMEINTVPCFEATDSEGTLYSKIPKLSFPVDRNEQTILVQGVTYYSKAAIYDQILQWRENGIRSSGRFQEDGTWVASLQARPTRYKQAKEKLVDFEPFTAKVFDGDAWGLDWSEVNKNEQGRMPQYFKKDGDKRVAISADAVPRETGLLEKAFKQAKRGEAFVSPESGSWATPGPAAGPFTVELIDGSIVTYAWYRFIDQPAFQQYDWCESKRNKLQSLIEQIHAKWRIDDTYMAPPRMGELVALDSKLIVEPPKGMEIGYVPIVTRQQAAIEDETL